jgi:hypothetical protein
VPLHRLSDKSDIYESVGSVGRCSITVQLIQLVGNELLVTEVCNVLEAFAEDDGLFGERQSVLIHS